MDLISALLTAFVVVVVAFAVAVYLNSQRANAQPFALLLQQVLRDLRTTIKPTTGVLHRLWLFWGPRLTNRAMIAVVMTDFSIAASGQDVWVWIAAHRLIAGAIVLMNLLCPLTPPGALDRIPAPRPTDSLPTPATA